jgi:hypothetical protein
MSTLVKEWREKQQQRRLKEAREEAKRNRSPEEVRAQQVIDDIPDQIEAAGGEESIVVLEEFDDSDVAGTRKDRLVRLYADLRKRRRTLRRSDLASVGALVFAWCDANDFECFLVRNDDGYEEPSYDFHIRPKKEAPVPQASSVTEGRPDEDVGDNEKKGKGKGKNKGKKPSYRL